MANYQTLKNAISDVIKTNGNNEITGSLLQQSLLAMINSLGAGWQYMGIATPSTSPGTPDNNVFYIASQAGTYSNFGGLSVAENEVAILKYNGSWTKDTTGAATATQLNQLGQKIDEIYGTKEVADKFTFGGTSNVITFNAISLAEDGDAIEFKVKCDPSASGAFAFAKNGDNIAISLSKAVLGIKSAANEWQTGFNASSGSYAFGSTAGAIDNVSRIFKLIIEGTSLKLYIDGVFYKELTNAPTITLDRLGGVHNSNYWSGELDYFRYTHSGVTTELLDFPGYSATGDVTVTTHSEESGLLSTKVDKVPGKGLSENDYSDAEKEKLDNVLAADALKMTKDFINLLEERALNDTGQKLSLPILKKSGYALFSGVNGTIYTNAANLVRLLLKPGTVTYKGVTLTIDDDYWVTMSGTASGDGYICYNDLTGYGGLDTAKAAVVIPPMPSGTYQIGICQKGSSSRASIYIRAKSTSSFLALLTASATMNATINMTDVGAMGAYLASGVTYNEKFRFMVMPTAVFNTLANITEYNTTDFSTAVRKIEKDGIYKYEGYTLGDGTATKIDDFLALLNYATKGVRCAWFGDSISALRNLPHLVGQKMAIVVNDCSFAGAPLAESTPAYTDTGFCSLASQIVDEDFSPAQTAINLQYTSGLIDEATKNEKLAQLTSLAALDFAEIDKIVILSGTNDLGVSAATVAGIKSSLTSALTTILTAYPQLQIYFVLPPYRTDAYEVHPNGLTLPDINNGIKEVCETFGIPCFDFLHNCGVNSVNYTRWLPDGLHPSDYGDEMFSTRIANWLKSIF